MLNPLFPENNNKTSLKCDVLILFQFNVLKISKSGIFFSTQNDPIPGPLPLGVAVIDSSVRLYGLIFPRVAHKHRYQMLQHFNECIKQAKSSRQQAVQMNIFTAVLCALKVNSSTHLC